MTAARRAAVAVAAAATILFAAQAAAAVQGRVVALPNPTVLLRPPPPLTPVGTAAREVRVPRPITSRERIAVGLEADGTPRSVRVVQRLVIRAPGDYTFVVPAPAARVRPGPGTATPPGLRTNQIVWQGFSPGRRVLVADADLKAGAATALPLSLRVETTVGGRAVAPGERASGPLLAAVDIRNTTGAAVDAFSADADRTDVATALNVLRQAVARDEPVGYQSVRVRGAVTPRRATASAPFRLRGELRFPAGSVRNLRVSGGLAAPSGKAALTFGGIVGGTAPESLHILVRGTASRVTTPVLRLVAEPVTPVVEVTGRGDGSAPLRRVIELSLSYERSRRYRTFLANPDATGKSSAVYVFATAPRAALTRSTAAAESDGGLSALTIALIATGAVVLVGAAVVVWAQL